MRYLVNAVRETYQQDAESHQAYGWLVERKTAGMNSLVYRLQSDTPGQWPLAVKISQRDERKRTLREFGAMQTLVYMGLREIVPFPLFFYDQPEGLPGDVLVMEWLSGEALAAPPPAYDTAAWRAILETFAKVHSVQPARYVKLYPAMVPVTHPEDMLQILRLRRERLPQSGQFGAFTAAELDDLLDTIARRIPLKWDAPPQTCLILCDSNPTNMIVDKGRVRLVDWANSGWSDGAFDIADMLAQPAYFHLSEEHRLWIRETYADIAADAHAVERILYYERMLYAFWVCLMTEPLVGARAKRIAGVKQYNPEHYETHQKLYWERVSQLFS